MKNLRPLITRTASSTEWKCKIPCVQQGESVLGEKETNAYQWSPPFYWYENDSSFVLEWDIPELTPGDLKLAVQQRNLIITNKTPSYPSWQLSPGRKHLSHFTQTIRLPRYVQAHQGEARYQFGKLIVSFPKTPQPLTDRWKSRWLSLTQALSTKPEISRYS